MSGNSILQCGRPSVIKWAGKNFTASEENSQTMVGGGNCTVRKIHAHTTLTQEYNQSTGFDESSEIQDLIINDDLVPKSKNTAKKYCCVTCDKTFSWRSHLQCHERIHTGEKPFQCDICDKAFSRSDGLQCHKKVHFKIKENGTGNTLDEAALRRQNIFLCTTCGRTFASLAGYSRHIEKKHKDKEELKCDICNIVFSRPSTLEIHSRVHTGEKPYRCSFCYKAFSLRANLKRHSKRHSGEGAYKCTHCTSCFNNSSHLARHVKSKHEPE